MQAGQQADAHYANAETERHYRTGAALAHEVADAEGEAEALERLSELLDRIERNDEAIATAQQALHLRQMVGDVDQIAWATMLLARAYNRAEHTAEGVKCLTRFVLSLAPETFPPLSALSIDEMISLLASSQARALVSTLSSRSVAAIGTAIGVHASDLCFFQEAMIVSQWLVPFAKRWGDATQLATALVHLGYHLAAAGYISQAIEVSKEAAGLAHTATDRWIPGNLWALSYALDITAQCSMAQGELGQAEEARRQSLQASETVEDVNGIVLALYGLSDVEFVRGEWKQSRQYLDRAANKLHEGEYSAGKELWLQARFGRLWLVMGKYQQGVAALEAVIANPAAPLRSHFFAQQALADWDLVEGRPQVALARLSHYATLTQQSDSDIVWLLPWAYEVSGDHKKAQQRLDHVIAEAQDQHLLLRLSDVLRVRALMNLSHQQWHEALHAIEEARNIAQAIPYPYAAMNAHMVFGQISAAQNDVATADGHYKAVLAICQQLGENLYQSAITRALEAQIVD